jgi:hypothetical protein
LKSVLALKEERKNRVETGHGIKVWNDGRECRPRKEVGMRVNRLTKCSVYIAKMKVANFGAFTDLLPSYMPLVLLNEGVGCAAIFLSAEQVR